MNWKMLIGMVYGMMVMSLVARLIHGGVTDVAGLKLATFGDKGLVQRQTKIPGLFRGVICLMGNVAQGDTIPDYLSNLAKEFGVTLPDMSVGTASASGVADTAVNV
jgi:hypothetical protein